VSSGHGHGQGRRGGFPRQGRAGIRGGRRLARAFTSTADRLSYDFGVRLLPAPWHELGGRNQALLTEIMRQLIIEGQVIPGG